MLIYQVKGRKKKPLKPFSLVQYLLAHVLLGGDDHIKMCYLYIYIECAHYLTEKKQKQNHGFI